MQDMVDVLGICCYSAFWLTWPLRNGPSEMAHRRWLLAFDLLGDKRMSTLHLVSDLAIALLCFSSLLGECLATFEVVLYNTSQGKVIRNAVKVGLVKKTDDIVMPILDIPVPKVADYTSLDLCT